MKSYRFTMLFGALLCSVSIKAADNLTYVTGAPVGDFSNEEPGYLLNISPSVDWFSEPIGGNYYLAALSPSPFESPSGTSPVKTIGVYQFVPGVPPENGSLVFVTSAPTGQCIFDQFSSQDVCDENFADVAQIGWYPSAINGEYFFTVVGPTIQTRLGEPGEQTIRVYRFNPDNANPANGTIDFIDSAPLAASENEPAFDNPRSIDWFPVVINGEYYFSVVGRVGNAPGIRVYSFNPMAPLGTNISFVGEAASGNCDPILNFFTQVDWAPELLNGQAFFAVGDRENLRVYRFCPEVCGSDIGSGSGSELCPLILPQGLRLELVTTSSTTGAGALNLSSGLRWLKAGQEVYIVAGDLSGKAKLFQFLQDINDPTTGILTYVTELPTGGISCSGAVDNYKFQAVFAVDWLIKDGAYYLVVGGGNQDQNTSAIRVYRFDPRRKRFTFLVETPTPGNPLPFDETYSVDWFPGEIEGRNYFAAGVDRNIGPIGSNFGSEDSGIVRVYSFDPLCANSLLSWRYPHIHQK